jgi:hypothetical protein
LLPRAPTKLNLALCQLLTLLSGTDRNCNFSAMQNHIELNLSGDLGWVLHISVYVLAYMFWRICFGCFQFVNKQTKNAESKKNGSRKLEFSVPCQVRLFWNMVVTSI